MSSGLTVTWHLDRLWRSATACAGSACALMVAVGVSIAAVSSVDRVLGGLMVGVVILGAGAALGSLVTAGAGMVMFGVIVALAKPGLAMLVVAGIAIVSALVLVDLSISLRRAPLIDRRGLVVTARLTLLLSSVGAAAAIMAWWLATRATWQAIVLPFGIIAIGYAARLAADAHLPSR